MTWTETAMTLNDPKSERLAFAGISTLTVLTWYALPDVIRSRGLRAVIKAGLLGVTALGAAKLPEVFPEAKQLEPKVDLSEPTAMAIAAGASAAMVAGTIWGEKAIYARGERRRARGHRCGHTPLALVMAVGTGALALLDWSKLAKRG